MKILYRNAIARTLRDYYIGSSKQSGTITFNMELLFERCKNKEQKDELTDLFVENLKTVERDWQYTVCVLHKTNDEIYYNFESGVVPKVTSKFMNKFIPEMMRFFIDECADGNECSWFWVISPHTSMNVSVSIDHLIDVFNQSNLLDLPPEEWLEIKSFRERNGGAYA